MGHSCRRWGWKSMVPDCHTHCMSHPITWTLFSRLQRDCWGQSEDWNCALLEATVLLSPDSSVAASLEESGIGTWPQGQAVTEWRQRGGNGEPGPHIWEAHQQAKRILPIGCTMGNITNASRVFKFCPRVGKAFFSLDKSIVLGHRGVWGSWFHKGVYM